MTVSELVALRMLNKRLSQAEHWIRYRTARSLFDYHRSGGANTDNTDTTTQEDARTDVSVFCILRESHHDFASDEDNVIATLDGGRLLLTDAHAVHGSWNEVRDLETHPLGDMRFSGYFTNFMPIT
ncbi:hypothetical protein FAZ95_01035 [Trinickia violacea]|uniref:Uncharacterized protein n=1 Tax=Trinickia violacea TaxID=2571746 RepID=A0A4V1EGT5_9BURK|nr:hypothetical protein [Trinickia violacea]QCP47890.1 hypothetical protein FAZ95_01035 [Trinickia violacea]